MKSQLPNRITKKVIGILRQSAKLRTQMVSGPPCMIHNNLSSFELSILQSVQPVGFPIFRPNSYFLLNKLFDQLLQRLTNFYNVFEQRQQFCLIKTLTQLKSSEYIYIFTWLLTAVCKTHCKLIIFTFIWFKNLNLKHFKP